MGNVCKAVSTLIAKLTAIWPATNLANPGVFLLVAIRRHKQRLLVPYHWRLRNCVVRFHLLALDFEVALYMLVFLRDKEAGFPISAIS